MQDTRLAGSRIMFTHTVGSPGIGSVILAILVLSGSVAAQATDGTVTDLVRKGEKESTGDESGLINIPIEFTEITRNKMKAHRGIRTARYTYVRIALACKLHRLLYACIVSLSSET